MKRFICALLIVELLSTFATPLSSAQNNNDKVSVNIMCQNNYNFFDSQISGIVQGNELYTTPEEINKLAGFNASVSMENGFMFVNENRVERCPYLLEGNVLTELFPFKDSQRKWDIRTVVDDSGDTLVNFEDMLYALGAEIKCSEGSNTISVNFPYSIDQAILDFYNTQGSFFSWTEVGTDDKYANSIAMSSSINSLLLDYNSHLMTDALFSWMDDNILNATEDQYFDTLKEILCYNPENYSDMSDDLDYGTFQPQNKLFSLTNDMANLLGFSIDEIEYLGKVSEIGGYGEITINAINEYIFTRNITDVNANVLKYGLVNCPIDSLFADEKVEPLVKAANHLNNLIDSNGVGATTELLDAIVEVGGNALSSATSAINPILTAIQTTEKIMKITPGLSDLTEKNSAIHTAANCYVIQELAFGEFSRLKNEYRYDRIPDEDVKLQMKYMLVLGLKASTTARDILLDYGLCGDYAYDVRNTNRRVSALLSRVEGIDFEITKGDIEKIPVYANATKGYEWVIKPSFDYDDISIISLDNYLPFGVAYLANVSQIIKDAGGEYVVCSPGTKLEGLFVAKKNGQEYLINGNGEFVLNESYDSISTDLWPDNEYYLSALSDSEDGSLARRWFDEEMNLICTKTGIGETPVVKYYYNGKDFTSNYGITDMFPEDLCAPFTEAKFSADDSDYFFPDIKEIPNAKCGLITNGKMSVSPEFDGYFDSAYSCYHEQSFSSNDRIIFYKNNKIFLYDRFGNSYSNGIFDKVDNSNQNLYFVSDFLPVCLNGKWGYIDLDGNTVVDCCFEDATSVYEGKAWVKQDGKWGIISVSSHEPVEDVNYLVSAQ